MEDKLIAACVEQTTETGTRFQCLEPGQPGEDARSIFLLEKAPKERVYFLSMSKTGEGSAPRASAFTMVQQRWTHTYHACSQSSNARASSSTGTRRATSLRSRRAKSNVCITSMARVTNAWHSLLTFLAPSTVAVMSKNHNVVAGTRGVQVRCRNELAMPHEISPI